MNYQVGDAVRLTATFKDLNGDNADPSAVTFKVSVQNGSVTTYVYGTDAQLVRSAVGTYYVDFTPNSAGMWTYQFSGTGALTALEEGRFVVSAPTVAGGYIAYATPEQLKVRAGITDTDDDAVIAAVLDAVSRAIDQYTNDRFYTTTSDETRYMTAEWSDLLIPRYAIVSLTTVTTDSDGDGTYETTWSVSDYAMLPYDAALDAKPYTMIETTVNGRYVFPVGIKKGVKLVGKFGWQTVPMPIMEACLLQAQRLFKRKDAIFGVVGSAEMGQLLTIPKVDPDVQMLLMPFRKMQVGAI